MSLRLVSETPDLRNGVEAVIDRAFGPGRYAKVSERVRERGARLEPALSRVAILGEQVVGACRIWSVAAGPAELFLLGPLAVDPQAQGEGIGAALVKAAIEACRANGGAGLIAVGAQAFFAPFGFSLVPAGRLTLPGPVDPGRFMWLALRPGGLDDAGGEVGAPGR